MNSGIENPPDFIAWPMQFFRIVMTTRLVLFGQFASFQTARGNNINGK
jgi:hypothetical protein